jgi:DNA-binding transcriptional LysR family regulator
MDKFAALRTYVAVVNAGSFARAAEKLGMSRAMATKHVQTLEAELGARLLNRTTRKLSATEAGRAFHARAERVLSDLDEAESAVADASASPKGLLRVAAPMSFGYRHLGPAIAEFMRDCPDMAVELSLNDRVVDLVDEGLDVALRIGRLAESSLVAKRIAAARLIPVASPAYLARKGKPKTPADLAWHDCLDYTLAAAGPEWRFTDRAGKEARARRGPAQGQQRRRVVGGGAGRARDRAVAELHRRPRPRRRTLDRRVRARLTRRGIAHPRGLSGRAALVGQSAPLRRLPRRALCQGAVGAGRPQRAKEMMTV